MWLVSVCKHFSLETPQSLMVVSELGEKTHQRQFTSAGEQHGGHMVHLAVTMVASLERRAISLIQSVCPSYVRRDRAFGPASGVLQHLAIPSLWSSKSDGLENYLYAVTDAPAGCEKEVASCI